MSYSELHRLLPIPHLKYPVCRLIIDCLMFNNDKINSNKDAAIIEGPDAVLNSSEENNPKITDNNPPIIEYITIF